MARVILTGEVGRFTEGDREIEVEATNVFKLFQKLAERYPLLAPHLFAGFAVAIDGELFQDALLRPISSDSEVHLIPKIEGG